MNFISLIFVFIISSYYILNIYTCGYINLQDNLGNSIIKYLEKQIEMSKRQCCITGCSNGGYRLKIWKSKICILHNSNYGTLPCCCNPPFQLFPFPTDIEERKQWSKAVNRKDIRSPNKIWEPNSDSRICSDHFVDKYPTVNNPYPTLSLGYEKKT